MKTFDYEQVSAVLGPLKAKFLECAHGEGDKCEMIDRQLGCCAAICCDLARALRGWALGVFSGEIVFDPAAENLWRSELNQIYTHAIRVWQLGRKAEVPYWELAGQNKLASALRDLHWLLDKWVTPKLSVGPSARVNLKLDNDQRAALRSQLSKLQ